MGFLDSKMGQTQLLFREVMSIRHFPVRLTEPGTWVEENHKVKAILGCGMSSNLAWVLTEVLPQNNSYKDCRGPLLDGSI